MYGMGDRELEARVARRTGGKPLTSRVVAEAARHVIDLRRALAAGKSEPARDV
jgi:hypothetical protein